MCQDVIPAQKKNWVSGRQKGVQREADYTGNMSLQIWYKNLDLLRAAAPFTAHSTFTQDRVRLNVG